MMVARLRRRAEDLLCAVGNERYRFTTWVWGKRLAALLFVGVLLKLAQQISLGGSRRLRGFAPAVEVGASPATARVASLTGQGNSFAATMR